MNSRGPKENRFLPKRKEEETDGRKNCHCVTEPQHQNNMRKKTPQAL